MRFVSPVPDARLGGVTPRAAVAIAGALVLALGIYLACLPRAPRRASPLTARAPGAGDDDPADRAGDPRPSRDPAAPRGGPSSPPPPALDRGRSDKLRARIRALLAEAGPARVRASVDTGSAAVRQPVPEMPGGGEGNQAHGAQGEYIRSVVREDFFPLARQCYAEASGKHPGLSGTLVLDFRIVGDPSVGGVVDRASVADTSDLQDDEFAECMTQSMMSVSFRAPPGGGEVSVRYPIVFSPEADDAGE